MSLPVGARLGPYEIVALIDAGGMGEVYRAKDTRLERVVAIKVLPDGVAASPLALERFQREAQAASALNHPNICTIYDVGADPPFIAMELLEGETLQQQLTRGPLRWRGVRRHRACRRRAPRCRAQQGHRPSRHQAREHLRHRARTEDSGFRPRRRPPLEPPRRGVSEATRSADALLTDPGSTLGTVSYMSPEQVRAHAAGRAHGPVFVRRRAL